jgi:quinol monooxygenase YgiN
VASVSRATSSRISDLLIADDDSTAARPAGKEKEFEAVAKELVAKVNAGEPGCKLYALHHGETPGTYIFMERYVDQAAVEAHRATEYFKALGRKMGEFMDGRPEVLRLREVE